MADVRTEALAIVRLQLREAVAAAKCHRCGCLQQTVAALEASKAADELHADLQAARATFVPAQYDCLGCTVCFPAIAANAYAEAEPSAAGGLDLCPTAPLVERQGWPPLPGDYDVVQYAAPIAVCTLHDAELARQLANAAPPGLGIVGTLHTENLGIERLIRNITANPHLRVLLVCGLDAQQAIGHLPGQSLLALAANGIDADGRILGARGKRPVLKNVTAAQIEAFRRQVRMVDRVGMSDLRPVLAELAELAKDAPGPLESSQEFGALAAERVVEPLRLVADPAGYLVVYPDRRKNLLALEHYTNAGMLDGLLEGQTAASVYAGAIARAWLTRLDHAAYLGRELARAEVAMQTGGEYVQDRAAGESSLEPTAETGCGCEGGCAAQPEAPEATQAKPLIAPRVGLGLVVAAVIAILAFKPGLQAAAASPPPAPPAAASAPKPAALSLLMIADPDEATAKCGCGQIIRMVRDAAKHGVALHELAPEADPAVQKRYRATLVPAVLLLDAKGEVHERFDGEGKDVVAKLRARLTELTAGQP